MHLKWYTICDVKLIESTDEKLVIEYTPYPVTDINIRHTVLYDKNTKTFTRTELKI